MTIEAKIDPAVSEKNRNDGHMNRFGSVHTKQKLDILGKYLPAYTTALHSRFTLHYLDAFAGTGVCHIKVDGERLMVPGSASVAMACTPQFHQMVFIEQSLRKAKALERLKAAAPTRKVEVIRSDANTALPACLSKLNAGSDRAIAFLDPYGMQVEWRTLQNIAESKVTDLWYLFPLSGLYRQATINAADVDSDKAAALTRILGTEDWRKEFYHPPAQRDFWDESEYRTTTYQDMLRWVKRRLESIFPGVADPKILYQLMPNGKDGPPMYALFFLISNPSKKAIGLAMRIARDILSK